MYNIRHIKPYKSDAKVEDFNSLNMPDGLKIWLTRYVILFKY